MTDIIYLWAEDHEKQLEQRSAFKELALYNEQMREAGIMWSWVFGSSTELQDKRDLKINTIQKISESSDVWGIGALLIVFC